MTISYLPLAWDSDFLGFKVGRIITPNINTSKLQEELMEFKKLDFKLVYVVISPTATDNLNTLAPLYNPIDFKVTYKFTYEPPGYPVKPDVIEYISDIPTTELQNLALEAGGYSRFKTDLNFKPGTYESLYSIWLIKSLNKQIADHTFVYKLEDKIVGFITIKISGNTGTIGLIAVNANHRGKGIGKQLIYKATEMLHYRGINTCFVVTQATNLDACRLYETCGFKANLRETYYHIWI